MDSTSRLRQEVVEEILVNMVSYFCEKYNLKNICIAGGVGLNCVANGKILGSGAVNQLFVQPAAGDAGGSLGAAFLSALACQVFLPMRCLFHI